MMKKIASIVMVMSMAASLAACGSSAQQAESAAESVVSQAASEVASDVESKEADVTTAAETEAAETEAAGGKLTMATNAEFEPWEFHEGDDIVGIDPEVAQAIAEKLGMEYAVEDMAFDAVIPAVATGKADIGMAAITVTEERKSSVDFTEPYAESALVVIVQSDNSEITGADALEGKKVGVQNGTTGDLKASELAGDENVERFPSYFEAIQSLKQGKVEAVVIDTAPAKVFLSQNDDLKQVGEEMDKEEYAIAVKKGNTELVEKLNAAIAELKEDGTFDAIVNKYIPAE
ncbi:MAG: basic amino acid ABC transporter substrate-binding protein [Eubacteriales bacterium]|nr:basic amino acid ABC transporter substrate-binding protein [Eubacteriales bacterium]